MYQKVALGYRGKKLTTDVLVSFNLHFHPSLVYDNSPQRLVHVLQTFLFHDFFFGVHVVEALSTLNRNTP